MSLKGSLKLGRVAGIEIGVMNQQCLDRRLEDENIVADEVAAAFL